MWGILPHEAISGFMLAFPGMQLGALSGLVLLGVARSLESFRVIFNGRTQGHVLEHAVSDVWGF